MILSKYFYLKFNKMKIFWQKSNIRNGVSLLSLPSTEHHCLSAKDCRGDQKFSLHKKGNWLAKLLN